MKIECTLKRKGGTEVTIDNKTYLFTPGQDKDGRDLPGPHICDVRDPKHVARFLSIPEAYRIYDQDGSLVDPTPTKTQTEAGNGGSNETGAQTGEGQGNPYAKMDREQLAAEIEERTGRKPHPNAKDETLRKVLLNMDQAKAT